MPTQDQAAPFGIVAGSGKYPLLMLQGAKKEGRRVVGVGFKGAQDKEFAAACDAYTSFRIGAVDGPIAFMQEHGVKDLVLTGQIKPSCIYTMWPDAAARRLLATLDRRNAHSIFGTLCAYIQTRGINILPSTTYLQDQMPSPGHVAGPTMPPEQLVQAQEGMQLARDIAQLDIGQSLIYHDGKALCVEGFKGTNECIAQGGHRDLSPILCKLTKEGHDMRFDVPCIGIGTIKSCIKSGIKYIVIEADQCMLLQAEEVKKVCEEQGISIHALPYPKELPPLIYPEHPASDAKHARMLAQLLTQLGIGNCAAVCDGVVITVGDADGPKKCLLRAAAYMKRLRFARLTNWLCGIFFGNKGSAPAPLVFSCSTALSPELQQLARKLGITIVD